LAETAPNPHAWFRERRSPEELTTVGPENRLIAFPYPKRMNAIIEVDQAAAVIMTSVGRARSLGIDPSRWVYLRGSADAHDHWLVSARVDYATSPAIRAAGRAALDAAGVGIEAVELFDLYSCFPAAVQIGRDMLGIADDDPRPLTVTGGLPYFGGPGNDYSMHAIARCARRSLTLRPARRAVTALGWYVTKHAIGVATSPPSRPGWPRRRGSPAYRRRRARPALVESPPNGTGADDVHRAYDRQRAAGTRRRDRPPRRRRRFFRVTPADQCCSTVQKAI
jgi:acetyl-CoA C-acetyltransferase